MKQNNKTDIFLQKVFERSKNPMAELEKINGIVPVFFANNQTVASANKRLDSFGYQINSEYIDGLQHELQMMSHPSCGSGNDYGYGHPSCGSGSGYGYGHPSCGSGSGYGHGHPSCGSSSGYGYGHPSCGSDGRGGGHPSCCSSRTSGERPMLLVRKINGGNHYGIRN